MNLFFRKSKKLILLLIVFLCPSFVFSQTSIDVCSPVGYSIYTINGINTDLRKAQENKKALEGKLTKTYKNEPLSVDFLYNPSHLAGIGDLVDAVEQGLFEQKSDYDLIEMLDDASEKVKTQKLLLVAHSQGNFYANNFYEKVASQPGGVPSQSIGMYGVASPASYVAGGGKYLTSDTDNLIAVKVASFINILPPNIHIPISAIDGNGHSFSNVYLKYQGGRIVSDINSSLDRLENNDEQLPESPCISPPELSFLHKTQGVILAIADPSAKVVKSGVTSVYEVSVYVANGVRDLGQAIGDEIHDTGLAIRDMFRNLSANTIASLPGGVNLSTMPPGDKEPEQDNSPEEQTQTTNTEATPSYDIEIQQESAPVLDDVVVPAEQNTTNIEVLNTDTNTDTEPATSLSNENENVTSNIPSPVVTNVVGESSRRSRRGGSRDTTPPVITLIGSDSVDVVKGTTYTDAGATANDEKDGVIVVVTTGSVDTSTIGGYTITYTAEDLSHNVSTLTRTVNVVADTTPPVITILGNSLEVVAKNSVYNDAGATALDDVDGVLVVTPSGIADVNTAIVGTYIVSYTATDLAGNTKTENRTVVVDDGAKLQYPTSVAISGNYAYVTSYNSNALEIIDISDPGTLIHKGSIVHGADGAIIASPKSVAVSGNYAYVVSYLGNALEIIDISNPVLPVHKSTLYDNNSRLLRPTFITVAGNYAYIISSGRKNVDIVDISDPANPVFTSLYNTNPSVDPGSVYISDNYMYLVYKVAGAAGGGLEIIDISNPALPEFRGAILNGTDGATISDPRSVFVSGNYAYIASWDTRALEIVDISNPSLPVHKGKLVAGFDTPVPFTPNFVYVSGNYAYVTSWVGETLEIIDISDPTNPFLKGSLANNIGGSALSYPSSVLVSGNYAYIPSHNSNAFEIVNISDPANPIHKNKILNGEFNHTDPVLNGAKQIISFNFSGLEPEVVGTLDESAHTIFLSVPFGTDVTTLVPTITFSLGASVNPNNNVSQDFTNPVTYVVTAENGSRQSYVVTVAVAPDSGPTLLSAEVVSATQVDLTFSEDLNGQTVTNADFEVTDHTLTLPDASESETGPGIVRLYVSNPFISGETPEIIYNTTVSNGVKDLDDNTVPARTIIATTNI